MPALRRPFAVAPAALAAVVAVLALVAAGCGDAASPAAATVGGDEIERRDFEDELEMLASSETLREQVGATDAALPAEVAAGWLQNLIYQHVVDEEFRARGLELSDDDRDAARTTVEQSFGAGFEELPDGFQRELVERAARVAVLRADLTGPEPSEAERRAYFEDQRGRYEAECPSDIGVSHILVDTAEEAAGIVAELDAGADFATLAEERSTDPGSAANGGSLGCYTPGTFVPEFEAGVEAAEPGVPTQPVESQFGFHVILVEEPYVTYDNYAARVASDMAAAAGDPLFALIDARFAELDVEVDRRYGSWVDDDLGPRVEPPAAPDVRDGRDVPDSRPAPEGVPLVPEG